MYAIKLNLAQYPQVSTLGVRYGHGGKPTAQEQFKEGLDYFFSPSFQPKIIDKPLTEIKDMLRQIETALQHGAKVTHEDLYKTVRNISSNARSDLVSQKCKSLAFLILKQYGDKILNEPFRFSDEDTCKGEKLFLTQLAINITKTEFPLKFAIDNGAEITLETFQCLIPFIRKLQAKDGLEEELSKPFIKKLNYLIKNTRDLHLLLSVKELLKPKDFLSPSQKLLQQKIEDFRKPQ